MKALKTLALAATVILLSQSCKKEGPQGPAGADGKDGNANVISTNTVNLTAWTADATTGGWQVSLSATGITEDVKNRGAVMVYLQAGSSWYPMPITDGVETSLFYFYTGGLTIQHFRYDGAALAMPSGWVARVVIIPASGMALHPDVDLKNYEEVKRTFNIK